ncbi:FecR family protein [Tenacibaculum sp. 190524A02b]|uniref:FecR family protein n=1 Tax=Tenacibaculum vairaonense TaxID=3137860 RepID=UPI0031FAAC9E
MNDSNNKYISDPSFLARWAANELTQEELAAFKASDAYKDFHLINEVAQQFKAPEVDVSAALHTTKERISFGKKTKKVKPLWYAVAASVVLLFGVYTFLTASITYTTGTGEQLAVSLPDGSRVQLNASSSLTHRRFLWTQKRELTLKGEGYFKVQKGEKFSVNTSYGTVSVLGTEFNVKSRDKVFAVHCFEGAVSVITPQNTEAKILRKGNGITVSNNIIKETTTSENAPRWLQKVSVFNNRPLSEIIEELSIQYAVTFDTRSVDVTRLFSGSFIHDNLEVALKTTLVPMGITYSITKQEKDGILIVLK